jgi:citrate synthase
MGTFYPEANPALKGTSLYKNIEVRNKQIFRILGKLPTIAACAYRHRIGRPYNNPLNGYLFSPQLVTHTITLLSLSLSQTPSDGCDVS